MDEVTAYHRRSRRLQRNELTNRPEAFFGWRLSDCSLPKAPPPRGGLPRKIAAVFCTKAFLLGPLPAFPSKARRLGREKLTWIPPPIQRMEQVGRTEYGADVASSCHSSQATINARPGGGEKPRKNNRRTRRRGCRGLLARSGRPRRRLFLSIAAGGLSDGVVDMG